MKKKVLLIIVLIIMSLICFALTGDVNAGEIKNEYWDNGKVRVVTEYGDMGSPVRVKDYRKDGSLERAVRYNDNGKKIAVANYDGQGGLSETADGWAAMKWQYSGGNMVAEGYYGSGGTLMEYKEYNVSGDLVNKVYVGDGDPDPSEEYEPMPTDVGETISYYGSDGSGEGYTSARTGSVIFPRRWNL
ncbi:MAG: hypothetical protein P9L90_02565 [Candidatus Aadella gelida]|nr:hypothetical protein [Candidatus Aadella gelida]